MFTLSRRLIETYRTKAALVARVIQSLLSVLAAIVFAILQAFTLWQVDSLILAADMTLGLSSADLSDFATIFQLIKETSTF